MKNYKLDLERYAVLARQATAEGCVLLENEGQALPLREGERVAVFGRMAFHYYKSGLGSGGLVNTRYVVGILDALKDCKEIRLDEKLMGIYEDWIRENPFDEGQGWGRVPWCQKEMEVTDEMLGCARDNDVSLVIIGRTAGEDQDNNAGPGSYCLTETEEDMIRRVCQASKRTVVVLNVGNIIDMSWVKKYHPQAVLYAWQGGQEGGNGVADVLTGKVCACGKLTDTIAERIEDYPSTENFGDQFKNYYKEDIYVGYRYFETFAKEKVKYPFGFGLSYTKFQTEILGFSVQGTAVTAVAKVTNVGGVSGRETVQLYLEAPQGKLGKPLRQLTAFAKTEELKPGETEELLLKTELAEYASYDDSGVTGHKSCYVLEEGDYIFYAGTDVRSAAEAGKATLTELRVVRMVTEAMAPVQEFKRLKPFFFEEKDHAIANWEDVPLRTIDLADRILKERPTQSEYAGDRGWKLADVSDGKITLEQFLTQLSDEDLICMTRGEGMCSPKVTPGTAAAFGGVTEGLKRFGIPIACCSDGPSGIRMDCGTMAYALPNGTLLACTFDPELVEELYEMEGMELRKNKIDTLLGPGINIHRNPLNGRNFEYFSEDPYLSGVMAGFYAKGLEGAGIGSCYKHFIGNNCESSRKRNQSLISERAIREIYFRTFEYAMDVHMPASFMTAYNAVNGCPTAADEELLQGLLREEKGIAGFVMTDWTTYDSVDVAAMVQAGNCWITPGSNDDTYTGQIKKGLENGTIDMARLQENVTALIRTMAKFS